MEWIAIDNTYLNKTQMLNNAVIIRDFFIEQGWTLNAICGMLGNMESESKMNPYLWQGRSIPDDIYTSSKGFGLTQWTPGSKLINWADEQGLPYKDGYTQLQRIVYESQNNLQWSTHNILNMTWDEYIISEESPETLARVFVWAYERPSDPDVELRQEQAAYWYSRLLSYNPLQRKGMPVWMMQRYY